MSCVLKFEIKSTNVISREVFSTCNLCCGMPPQVCDFVELHLAENAKPICFTICRYCQQSLALDKDSIRYYENLFSEVTNV